MNFLICGVVGAIWSVEFQCGWGPFVALISGACGIVDSCLSPCLWSSTSALLALLPPLCLPSLLSACWGSPSLSLSFCVASLRERLSVLPLLPRRCLSLSLLSLLALPWASRKYTISPSLSLSLSKYLSLFLRSLGVLFFVSEGGGARPLSLSLHSPRSQLSLLWASRG